MLNRTDSQPKEAASRQTMMVATKKEPGALLLPIERLARTVAMLLLVLMPAVLPATAAAEEGDTIKTTEAQETTKEQEPLQETVCTDAPESVQKAEEAMAKANSLYAEGRYGTADTIYTQIAQRYESAALYYNWGNTLYQQKKNGRAIAAYNRALKMDPAEKDAIHNLELARSKTVDHINYPYDNLFRNWIVSMANSWSSNTWAYLSIVLFMAALVGAGVYVLTAETRNRKIGFFTATGCLTVFALTTYFASVQKEHTTAKDRGVIVADATQVKTSPERQSKTVIILHEGAELKITDQIGEYVEIELGNGSKGFVDKGDIEII